MIKYSWYIVMKTNFENARPVPSSRALATSHPEEDEDDGQRDGGQWEEEEAHQGETGDDP